MRTLADLLSDPTSWRSRDEVARAVAAELGIDAGAAAGIAATLAHQEESRAADLEELWQRRRLAEVSDDVVQGLTAAIYALELEDLPTAQRYLRQTLRTAGRLMSELHEERCADVGPGRALVRSGPATLAPRARVRRPSV